MRGLLEGAHSPYSQPSLAMAVWVRPANRHAGLGILEGRGPRPGSVRELGGVGLPPP